MNSLGRLFFSFFCFILLFSCTDKSKTNNSDTGRIYEFNSKAQTRWSSFENPLSLKGQAAASNHHAKGSSDRPLKAAESVVLLNTTGAGVINRMWFTFGHWQEEMFRSLVLKMYWDGSNNPAVCVPFGDFFCKGLGNRTIAFENELFADPEGRSFNCYIRMPFRKGARIELTNESANDLTNLFYDIDFESLEEIPDNAMYFHAYWHRDTSAVLGQDFEILPKIKGYGRFLGCNIIVNANPAYEQLWWGEGEVKMYLDGDSLLPTLAGTGSEDYIGTGWGEGEFSGRYEGCVVADSKNLQWNFYRFHIPDPVWFHQDIKVTIQELGGGFIKEYRALLKKNVAMIPVVYAISGGERLTLLDMNEKYDLTSDTIPDGFVIFYRSDDYASTAYFYLDKPDHSLPGLQDVNLRTMQALALKRK